MQFSINLYTKKCDNRKPLICVKCDHGIDFIDNIQKAGYDVKADDIHLDDCYHSYTEYVIVDEELARKLLVFKNTNHVEVVCAENSLNDFITQKIFPIYSYQEFYTYKKFLGIKYRKQKNKSKHLRYIDVKNEFDKEKFLKWWGENGCPCVIGDVEDPFDEGAENA